MTRIMIEIIVHLPKQVKNDRNSLSSNPVKHQVVEPDICKSCNERYCGNCMHSNGKAMNY